MKLRKLHRLTAIIMTPFLLLLATSGCLLFFRHADIYSKETKNLLVSIHTWEIMLPYIGLFMGIGLFILIFTGITIYFKKSA